MRLRYDCFSEIPLKKRVFMEFSAIFPLTVSPITPKSYGPIARPFSVVAHRTLLAPCAACATRAAAPGREAGLGSHIVAARPLQRASAGFLEVLLFKKGRCSNRVHINIFRCRTSPKKAEEGQAAAVRSAALEE